MPITISHYGLTLVFDLQKEKPPLLLHLGTGDVYTPPSAEWERLYGIQEIQATGESRLEHFGVGLCGTLPAGRMVYTGHQEMKNEFGPLLEIRTVDPVTHLTGCMRYQFFDGLPVVRCENILTNTGDADMTLEGVSTFVQAGIADEKEEDLRLLIPHNSWQEELQWREVPVDTLGYRNLSEIGMSCKRIQIRSLGSWSSGEYLPLGCLKNVSSNTIEFWQIEHNGPWNWEIQERDGRLSLLVNGPDELNHGWWKTLKSGESFTTVPACIGCVEGGIDEAFSVLTKYRRTIRRPNKDNEKLPIIFNDYMNCLFGDPTTEKELPIIDAAAALGCEYFVIDAGWYTDENWWYKVGEWEPSEARFPGGLKKLTNYIHAKGMIPGLWLEIEAMGNQCPLSGTVDDSWFLQRHGKRSMDRSRYHLDFRNPEVRAYTRGVIDRLIRDFGIGYFKIDYNINAFRGTDYHADSAGDGLLSHNRAYLAWLDDIFHTYPDLVIENCGSGGMRMDHAMLQRYSIQSTSDQTDYRKYASIAANAPSALTPEQAAVWCYPLADSDEEQVIFNCVNAGLLRIHQSGHLGLLPEENLVILREFYTFYRKTRAELPKALPFWPLGLARDGDGQMALGLCTKDRTWLAVWRLTGEEEVVLPLPRFAGTDIRASVGFPKKDSSCRITWDRESGLLKVKLPKPYMARIIEIRI